MMRTRRFLSLVLAAVMLMAVPSALADSRLAGTTWVLNSYQTADGNAACTVLTQQAALDWIGFYYQFDFYSGNRFSLYYVDDEGSDSAEGSWYESGGYVYMTEDSGSQYTFEIGSDGMLYISTTYGDLIGMAQQSAQSGRGIGGIGNRGLSDTPSADPFSGTTWAATSIDTIYSGINLGGDDFDLSIGDLMSMVTFVKNESQLRNGYSLASVLCTMDFHTDHTFSLTMMFSALGQVSDESTTRMSGTWNYAGGTLDLTVDGQTVSCICQNGRFSMGVYGINMVFEPVAY